MGLITLSVKYFLFRLVGIFLVVLSTGSFVEASSQPAPVKVLMDYWAPYYRPVSAVVPDGGAIHIVNSTSSPHTVTHEGCRGGGTCAFDTGTVQPRTTFIIPPLPPGRYSYFCMLHPIMKGEIVVIPHDPILSHTSNTENHELGTSATKDQ
jgi:plastocyanin